MRKIFLAGATSAIAQACARIWAERGDALFLVARNAERLEAIAADLRVRGAKQVETRVLDLCDLEAHPGLVDEAVVKLGGIDMALIAHGTLGDQEAAQRDFEVAEAELRNNFISAASLLSVLANHMEAQGRGTLAAISSVAGDRGRQSNYVYGSAKAGLSAFLSGLRNRLHKSGVSVVTIKPGFVDTPMTAHVAKGPLFASPEKVGAAIVAAMEKGRAVVYVPTFWRLIMFVVRSIPERIFQRLSL